MPKPSTMQSDRNVANKAVRHRYKRCRKVKHRCFVRDAYQCQTCGEYDNLECHHIVPLHKGGTDTLDNVVTMCKHCHKRLTDAMQSKRGRINPRTGLRF